MKVCSVCGMLTDSPTEVVFFGGLRGFVCPACFNLYQDELRVVPDNSGWL